MNHFEQAVEAIRKSPDWASMDDFEPITVEAMQRDVDELDAELDAIEDDIEYARCMGDEREAQACEATRAALLIGYDETWRRLEMLQAAVAADASSIH